MLKRVLIAGVLGAVVMTLLAFLVNGIFGFHARIAMKVVPNESRVYQVLKENIVQPGGYVCNPPLTPGHMFPEGEPVYGIHYSGKGHEIAGSMMLRDLAVGFAAALIAAALLAMASPRVLSAYARRVLFIFLIGLLLAVFYDLRRYGIGGYPLDAALLLAIYELVSWTVAGLVIAALVRPRPAAVPEI